MSIKAPDSILLTKFAGTGLLANYGGLGKWGWFFHGRGVIGWPVFSHDPSMVLEACGLQLDSNK